jgi:hypothetical protein
MYRLEEIVREFHKQGCLVYLTEYAPSVKVEISKTEIGEMAVLHPSLAFCIGDAKEKLQTSS